MVLPTVSLLRGSGYRFGVLALPCLVFGAPATSGAQSCDSGLSETQVVGGIACPDGEAATVVPADSTIVVPAANRSTVVFNPDRLAAVEAATEAGSGSKFYVAWSGPGNQGDYIAIADPNTPGGQYLDFSYAQAESPLQLTAPDAAGGYEVRYVAGQSRDILASQLINVTEATATIENAAEVEAGSSFDVVWSGPDNAGDYVSIAEAGTTGHEYRNYTYAQQESPLTLTAPDEPGEYEVRYVQRQSRTILASNPVTVTAVSATLATAAEVSSGSSFEVAWTGPGHQGDYVSIAEAGTTGHEYRNYTYAQQESPLTLLAPDEPGEYEVRYVQRQSRTILASNPVTVTAVSATLATAAEVSSGSSFEVAWTGPGHQGDYVSIAEAGTTGYEYRYYTYAQQESPLTLTAPDEPGEYEVRYVQRQSRTILSAVPIEVLAVNANVQAPATAMAGERFDVTWNGPANQGDYISIAELDAPGTEYQNYSYVGQGSPLQLTAPLRAGNWEVRYVQRQSRAILARQTIRIVE